MNPSFQAFGKLHPRARNTRMATRFMHIISGSVTLTHPDGRSETFTVGDTFFIPKGSPCTWENTETMRKFYMIAAKP